MTIIERTHVRAAFERALALDGRGCRETAIATVAQALCLPVEAVGAVVEEAEEAA